MGIKSTIIGILAGFTAACAVHAANEPAASEWKLATVTPDEALAIDALLTTVNGKPIYAKDVIRPLDAELRTMAQQSKSLREFKELVAGRLDFQLRETVRNILLFSAAEATLSDEEKKRVDVVMNVREKEILSRYQGSKALAQAALLSQGTSLERELEFRRRQTTVGFYQHKVLVPLINVRRRDVVEEYENNLAKYTIEPEVDLYMIRIEVKNYIKDKAPTDAQIKAAESAAWAQAQEVYKRLQNGADFAKVAAEKFNEDARGVLGGGHYPHEKRKNWKWKELPEKMFAAESNSLIPPFAAKDPSGDAKLGVVFVLKVGEVVKGRTKNFEEVQEEITRELQAEQEMTLNREMTHKLYERSAIDNKENLQRVLETVTKIVVSRYAVQEEK
jgi:hypothetical protein